MLPSSAVSDIQEVSFNERNEAVLVAICSVVLGALQVPCQAHSKRHSGAPATPFSGILEAPFQTSYSSALEVPFQAPFSSDLDCVHAPFLGDLDCVHASFSGDLDDVQALFFKRFRC